MTGEAQNLPELQARKRQYKRLKHGLWSLFNETKIDGRTHLGKAIALLRRELVDHLGGSPSIVESLLIDRIIAKSIKCFLYERKTLSNPAISYGSRDIYLATANSLRLDIQCLGLKKKAKKILDLDSYLRQKEDKDGR